MSARLFALFTMLLLSACATVGGVGEDISRAGDAVSDAAREAEEDL